MKIMKIRPIFPLRSAVHAETPEKTQSGGEAEKSAEEPEKRDDQLPVRGRADGEVDDDEYSLVGRLWDFKKSNF